MVTVRRAGAVRAYLVVARRPGRVRTCASIPLAAIACPPSPLRRRPIAQGTTVERRLPPSLAPGGPARPDAFAAATVAPAAAAARAVRFCVRAGDGGGGGGRTAIPAVRAQVLRAPVQQPRPVRLGGRLRDRRRVRVSLPRGGQRARRTRPYRPLEERLSRRTLEYHGYGINKLVALACDAHSKFL